MKKNIMLLTLVLTLLAASFNVQPARAASAVVGKDGKPQIYGNGRPPLSVLPYGHRKEWRRTTPGHKRP